MTLFAILFCLFALIFLFVSWTNKYINIYTLTIIFGKKGCGKSTLLHKLAHLYKKKGWNVYCNEGDSYGEDATPIPIDLIPLLADAYKDESLRSKVYEYYKKHNLLDKKYPLYVKPESLILVDEINLLWDNRNFKEFSKDLQRYFRLQRHYRHIFIGFSQTYDCDKKLRSLADNLLICSRFLRIFVRTKAYFKKVVVVSPDKGNSRETAIMTDDFVRKGIFYDLFSPYQCFLPYWVKKHDSFK